MLLNSTKMQSDNTLQFEIPSGLQSWSELIALKIKGQRRSPDRRGAAGVTLPPGPARLAAASCPL